MLFNSAIFFVFFICVYVLYWAIFRRHRLWVLLISGCVFYGSWDVRFLFLLFFTSGVDFFSAQRIERSTNNTVRKRWLITSILINLITLGIFKYYNFFAASFSELMQLGGMHPSFTVLKIILPVGVSFYTFQSIAYVTDVYRRTVPAERSALYYFAFICFFPQMVAGPIERAKRLLPQFKSEKKFSVLYLQTGLNLVMYGFFKKIVIADNLALLVDEIHANTQHYNSGTLLLGVFAFAFQIYADFSGYSDIARGCAQLLGFKLSKNFNFPYFSASLREFWRRWHISLSTWFRDYVYIPLGGNQGTQLRRNRNYLVTFIVSGLWHGANLTFIFWGFFHGLGLILERMIKGLRVSKIAATLFVFIWVSFLFTLFRADSLKSFVGYMQSLFIAQGEVAINPGNFIESGYYFTFPLLLFFILEFTKYIRNGLAPYKYNFIANLLILVSILLFSVYENAPRFIYFQF